MKISSLNKEKRLAYSITSTVINYLEKLKNTKDYTKEKELKYLILEQLFCSGLFQEHYFFTEEICIFKCKDHLEDREYTIGIKSENTYYDESDNIIGDFYIGIAYEFVDKNELVVHKI